MRCKSRSFYVWGVKVLPHNASVLVDGEWRPVSLHQVEPGSRAVCIFELDGPVPVRVQGLGILELDPERCFGRRGRRVDVEALSLRLAGEKRRLYLEAVARTAVEPASLAAVLQNPASNFTAYRTAAARLDPASRERLMLEHFSADETLETLQHRRRLTVEAFDALARRIITHRQTPARDEIIARVAAALVDEDAYPSRVSKILNAARAHPGALDLLVDGLVEKYPACVLEYVTDPDRTEHALRAYASNPELRGVSAIAQAVFAFERLTPDAAVRVITADTLQNPSAVVFAYAAHLNDPGMIAACTQFADHHELREQAERIADDRALLEPPDVFLDLWLGSSRTLPPDRPAECLNALFPAERESLDPAVKPPTNDVECHERIDAFAATGAYRAAVDEYAVLVWSHTLAAGTAGAGAPDDWRYLTALLAHASPSASVAALGGSTELARMRRARLVAACDDRAVLEVFARRDAGRVAVAALKRLDDPQLWRDVAATHAPAAEAAPLEVLTALDPASVPAKVRAVLVTRGVLDPQAAAHDEDYRVRAAAARVDLTAAASLVVDDAYAVAVQAVNRVQSAEQLEGVTDRLQVAPRRHQELLWYELAASADDDEVARVAVARVTDPHLLAKLHTRSSIKDAVAAQLVSGTGTGGYTHPPLGEHPDHSPEPF